MMNEIPNYDKWKLHNPNDDEKVIALCVECDGEIYQGEEAYPIDEDYIHEDCFLPFCKTHFNTQLEITE